MSTDAPVLRQVMAADAGLINSVVDLYTDLHRFPELSMQEYRTIGRIERELAGIDTTMRRLAGTGLEVVVANGSGPRIAMRGDIDALPIAERTGLRYASVVGQSDSARPAMHACGHDLHAACLVGVIKYLCRHRDRWSGTFIAVFQPGEETGEGALAMINDGLFSQTGLPEVMLGQHVTSAPVGRLLCRPGPFLSRQRSWRVQIDGVGGHAARPHLCTDPIVAAAMMIVRLQTIVSREIDPFRMAVVTVGTMHGGTKENVIPATAEFTVSTRSHEESVGARIDDALVRIITAEAAAANVEVQLDELAEVPPCYNDPDATARVHAALAAAFGSECVDSPADPLPASDDFGQYRRQLGIPSVIWNFGCQEAGLFQPGGPQPPRNHDARFAPAIPGAIEVGVAGALAVVMAWLGRR